jgi:hypothetical protein
VDDHFTSRTVKYNNDKIKRSKLFACQQQQILAAVLSPYPHSFQFQATNILVDGQHQQVNVYTNS